MAQRPELRRTTLVTSAVLAIVLAATSAESQVTRGPAQQRTPSFGRLEPIETSPLEEANEHLATARRDRALAEKLDSRVTAAKRRERIERKRLAAWERSLAAYERAWTLAPELHEALAGRGVALRGLGRLDEALTVLSTALEQTPEDHGLIGPWTLTLLDLGRYDETLAAHAALVELRPRQAAELESAAGSWAAARTAPAPEVLVGWLAGLATRAGSPR